MLNSTKLALCGVSLAALSTSAFAQDIVQADNEWFAAGQTAIEAALAKTPITGTAKNVILMISDGNGVGTNYASRLWAGQQAGGFGDEYVQPHEAFPNLALVKTYNVNAQTPDSAGTGTAMMAGIKTKAGIIGVNANVERGNCATLPGNTVTAISEIAEAMGKSVGVISTARITHATPASMYSKTVDRNFEDSVPEGCTEQKDIATQLIDAMEAGLIDVAMGGGLRHFLPDGTEVAGVSGRRGDGVNLVERAQGLGAQFATDSDSFAAIDLMAGTPVLGLFEASHMQYEADRDGEPSLAEMTAATIEALQGNENGFVIMIEAGRVDHANHAGNLARVVADQKAFADAVAIADDLTDDSETLIVVTADHEHAIAFNGYCGRGSDILGLCMGIDGAGVGHTGEPLTAKDGKPYTVAGYLNGAGSVLVEQADGSYFGTRPGIDQDTATDVDYLQQALVPLSSETHSGEDVAVYAKGPWAHLLDGTIEQNVIFHVMHHALSAE